ncbi:MAG: alpha-glucan family phosphorylase [Myxococcales bacterium]|nr:alpha-glucan family phosphorylase [Myxococcales bacterium]
MQIKRVSVIAVLPERLKCLRGLAYNFWWSWQPDAASLFSQMEPALWEKLNHNPVKLLRVLSQRRLEELAADQDFCSRMDDVIERFDRYMKERAASPREPFSHERPIAYFSAEFGLHESLQVYSGGLGILAGDHCKAASDLKLPLVGMGLLYKSGYFVQTLTSEGVQEANYPELQFDELALVEARDAEGRVLHVSVNVAGRDVEARVWSAKVGHVSLFLLDTDIPENDAWARQITSKLYGGGIETRIAQEMILGIGGVRALAALGIKPSVFHINEGHAAFLSLERIRQLSQEEGLLLEEALPVVSANQVFTTHTPVPEGHDHFDVQLFGRYVGPFVETMGIDFEEIWSLGTVRAGDYEQNFYMTILALRTSRFANAVSALHGEVSRAMWQSLWPQVPEDEIPIQHVTNGVHTSTWLSSSFLGLYKQYLGEDWEARQTEASLWEKVDEIPDQVLWEAHQASKETLLSFVRSRVETQRRRLEEPPHALEAARHLLRPDVLTVGFARRFAPYKRATLLFHDLERLEKIVCHPERPIQFIFAGKSHPHNQAGKDILQEVYQVSRMPAFEGKIVFVEDYDTNVGRHLVQGVDVWLNTPIRPQEASGTSGQKVAFNGGLNASILDGWWVEAYNGENGWAIGRGVDLGDRENQDYLDAMALYDCLEYQIASLYYEEGEKKSAWLRTMRASMKTICPFFHTHRMVTSYCEEMYRPAAEAGALLASQDFEKARTLSKWKERLHEAWGGVQVESWDIPTTEVIEVGQPQKAEAIVSLGMLQPEDVAVEFYIGRYDGVGALHTHRIVKMELAESLGGGRSRYVGMVSPDESGEFGFSVRVVPSHPWMGHRHAMGWVCWG